MFDPKPTKRGRPKGSTIAAGARKPRRRAISLEGRANNIRKIIPVMDPQFDYEIISYGSFDLANWIAYINDSFGDIEHLGLTAWMINHLYVRDLSNRLTSGQVRSCDMFFGSYLKQRNPDVFSALAEMSRQFKCPLSLGKTHAKILTATTAEHFITVRSSANLGSNHRYEFHSLTFCLTTHTFYNEWIVKRAREHAAI